MAASLALASAGCSPPPPGKRTPMCACRRPGSAAARRSTTPPASCAAALRMACWSARARAGRSRSRAIRCTRPASERPTCSRRPRSWGCGTPTAPEPCCIARSPAARRLARPGRRSMPPGCSRRRSCARARAPGCACWRRASLRRRCRPSWPPCKPPGRAPCCTGTTRWRRWPRCAAPNWHSASRCVWSTISTQAGLVLALGADPFGHAPDSCALRSRLGARARCARRGPGGPAGRGRSRRRPVRRACRRAAGAGAGGDRAAAGARRRALRRARRCRPGARSRRPPASKPAWRARCRPPARRRWWSPVDSLSPRAHALACALNQRLGAFGHTVRAIEPPEGSAPHGLTELLAAIDDGQVDTLLVLGGNPAYDAPAALPLAQALARVPFSVHAGLYADETSRALPMAPAGQPRLRAMERCARLRRHGLADAAGHHAAVRHPLDPRTAGRARLATRCARAVRWCGATGAGARGRRCRLRDLLAGQPARRPGRGQRVRAGGGWRGEAADTVRRVNAPGPTRHPQAPAHRWSPCSSRMPRWQTARSPTTAGCRSCRGRSPRSPGATRCIWARRPRPRSAWPAARGARQRRRADDRGAGVGAGRARRGRRHAAPGLWPARRGPGRRRASASTPTRCGRRTARRGR